MNKIIKIQIVSIILCLVIGFSNNVNINAAVKPQKVTLAVGETKQLKVWKKDVIWTVSRKNYIKLSKTGKMKALKKGKVTVIAKHGKKKKKFVVNIKDSYLEIDFSKIKKMEIRNLNTGVLVEPDKETQTKIISLFQKENIIKYVIADTKTKVGSMRYKINLYNQTGEVVYNINLNETNINIYNGSKYKCKKKLNLSVLDELFKAK